MIKPGCETVIVTESGSSRGLAWLRRRTQLGEAAVIFWDGTGSEQDVPHGWQTVNVAGLRSGGGELNTVWDDTRRAVWDWYRLSDSSGEDWSSYDGISLGPIVEMDVVNEARRVVEMVTALERLAHLLRAVRVIAFGRYAKEVASVLQQLGIRPTHAIRVPVLLGGDRWRVDKESVIDALKHRGLDRYVRYLLLGLSSMPGRGGRDREVEGEEGTIAGVLEQPGSYLADQILPVLAEFGRPRAFVFDPRHLRAVRTAGLGFDTLSQYLWRPEAVMVFARARRTFRKRWREFRGRRKKVYHHDSRVDMWEYLLPIFRTCFLRRFPLAAAEVVSTRRLLARRRPRSVLLTSDAHHAGRMMAIVAGQVGIPTVVIQHGVTAGELGYVPLYATRIAAWGEFSKRWLEQHGVSGARICVTGQPRFDKLMRYVPQRSKEHLCEELGCSATTDLVVWIVDPLEDSVNERIAAGLVEAVTAMPRCTLVVRLHPGKARIWKSRRWVKDATNATIARGSMNLHDLLSAAAVTVIQQSTAGLEAMLLGTPVVKFDPFGMRESVPYGAYKAAPDTRTPTELRQAIVETMATKDQASDRWRAGRERLLMEYIGDCSERSSKRVARLVRALAASGGVQL